MHIKSRVGQKRSMMIRNDNNRNRRSKHRYTANQTRMPLFRIFGIALCRIPLPEIGQLERSHRDSVPWIRPCPLTLTFHPHLRPSRAPPRRTGDTARSSLGESGGKLFRSLERSNPAGREPITRVTIPCSANI
jgi:hypothetical protein